MCVCVVVGGGVVKAIYEYSCGEGHTVPQRDYTLHKTFLFSH